ncbi:MAG: DUF5107 domain-containing protein, partial [Eubacteriales bacterium]
EAGLLHVADHHISPGKKQWTWGNSDFGKAWDRNLTDEDGPYIELMTGVFTDNQPDFTWLKPYEEKKFTQYFMPYKGVGKVKNATRNAMVNLNVEDGMMKIKVYSTSTFEDALILVKKDEEVLFEKRITLTPEQCYEVAMETELSTEVGCKILVFDQQGMLLVDYLAVEKELKPTPNPAEPLLKPNELKSLEELYLAAMHLEQYRHATYNPESYYLEGLKRDSTDIRLNNGYGLLLYKKGEFKESIKHFNIAIKKQTWKNPNPYHGESYFNLGLAKIAIHQEDEAYDAFYKATWSYETQSAGFFWLACLSTRKGNLDAALDFVDKSLITNWHHMKARALKAAIIRIQKKQDKEWIKQSIEIDPLSHGCLYEQGKVNGDFTTFEKIMSASLNNYLELALDYIKWGLYEDALDILNACSIESPLIHYYKSYIYLLNNNEETALKECETAESINPDYCFPNKTEEIIILRAMINLNKKASYAHYYLGNLLYDKKEVEKAVKHWEASNRMNQEFAMTYRNLSIAYFNKENNPLEALEMMKKAFELEQNNSRFLLEYNQLLGKVATSNEVRLSLLEEHIDLVKERDVLYLDYITVLNNVGRYEKALKCIENHVFHPWEGGEGKVSEQYKYTLTEMAIQHIMKNQCNKAIELLIKTLSYPSNLGEGKLPNVQDNIAHYYLGVAYRKLGNDEEATKYFKKASIGLEEPSSVLYYNDQPSDTIFYQGLAHEALDNLPAAKKAYHQLLSYGEKHLFDDVEYDYFAVSLPEIEVFQEDIQKRNTYYNNYLIALGKLGLEDIKGAKKIIEDIIKDNPAYQGGLRHLEFINRGK